MVSHHRRSSPGPHTHPQESRINDRTELGMRRPRFHLRVEASEVLAILILVVLFRCVGNTSVVG